MSLHAELIARLRKRADFICGEKWEVPATTAMMREAADALARADTEQRAAFEAGVLERVEDYIRKAMKPQGIAAAASEGTWDRGRRSGLQEALNSITAEREAYTRYQQSRTAEREEP